MATDERYLDGAKVPIDTYTVGILPSGAIQVLSVRIIATAKQLPDGRIAFWMGGERGAPVTEKLTYAKAGGPPDDWRMWRVFNSVTGEEIREVIEVNTVEGWCDHCALHPNGMLIIDEDHVRIERLKGAFELRRVDDQPETLGPRKVYGE